MRVGVYLTEPELWSVIAETEGGVLVRVLRDEDALSLIFGIARSDPQR